MGKYSVRYISSAVDDLENIFTYIAEDNTRAADNFLNEIDEAILHLEDFPNMGVIPKNRRIANKGYRYLIVNDYLVFYVIADDIIKISRIISSKRNYMKLI